MNPVPLTVNQFFLGHAGTTIAVEEIGPDEGYMDSNSDLEELTTAWWNICKNRALPTLLSHYRWKQSKHHRNLRKGDICLMVYESKVAAQYRLCQVVNAKLSDDGCVRTVEVGYLPKNKLKKRKYIPNDLETKEVAENRLCLLMPIEDMDKVWNGEKP